jgi:hypothetical protein
VKKVKDVPPGRVPIILATQKAELRRITVQSQPGKIVCKTLSQQTLHKNRAGGVTQGKGPQFKTQDHPPSKKKKKTNTGLL